jgi:hypothetical protein
MTARERANVRWKMTEAPVGTQVRVLYVHHERGCHGRKRNNRTCACWLEAFEMLKVDPDLVLSDGTRGGV